MAGRLEIVDRGKMADSPSRSHSGSRISSGQRARPIRTGSATTSRSSTPLGSGQSTPLKKTQLVSVRRKSEMSAEQSITDGADDDEELSELMNLKSDTELSSKPKSSQPSTSTKNQSDTQSQSLTNNIHGSEQPATSQSCNKSNTQSALKSNSQPKSQPARETVQDNSSSGDDSDSDEEIHKVPNQLIMEFLECVMNNDMENSLKLCKMILIYEPSNAQALKFLPLLQEKKELDARPPDTDSESDESGEDDSNTESSEDDSEEDSSESDEEKEQTTTNNTDKTCAVDHS